MLAAADKSRPLTQSLLISRPIAFVVYSYVAGLTVLSLAPRHITDFLGDSVWPVMLVGADLVLVSNLVGVLTLLRRHSGAAGTVLLWCGVGVASFSLLTATLVGADLALAYTCCPGPHALGAVLIGYVVAGLDFFILLVYVPATLAVLVSAGQWRIEAGASIRYGLTLAVIAVGLSVALAPHYFQEIGGLGSVVEAVILLTVAVLLGFVVWSRWAGAHYRWLVLRGSHLAIVSAVLLITAGYQALVYPPDDPSQYSVARSRSITLIAPPNRPDLLQELTDYQAEWDRVQRQTGAPNLTFDIWFDGVVALRPHKYEPGESDVHVKRSESHEERLMTFRQAAAGIAEYYTRELPAIVDFYKKTHPGS